MSDQVPFHAWEAALYGLLNSLPYMTLVLWSFRRSWRFERGPTLALLALCTCVQVAITTVRLLLPSPANPLYDALITVVYVAFAFAAIRERPGKIAFCVLVLMDLGNLVVVLGKFLEGQLFGSVALARYHVTYALCMLPVEAILIPVTYSLILRDLASPPGEGDKIPARAGGVQLMWRYLWLVPAVFYLVWTHHFYASGKTALQNALDPMSVTYLLLIDAGSVLIYTLIVRLVREQERTLALEGHNHALALQLLQYQGLSERIDEARRARHDLRHFVTLLERLRDGSDPVLVDELISSLGGEDLYTPLSWCQNEAANAVIGHFAALAAKQGTAFECAATLPQELFVSRTDLCVLLGNLLENAVEACSFVRGGRIMLSASVEQECLAVCVENDYVVEAIADETGNFHSTKHAGMGIGIRSVRDIAARYDGASSFVARDGRFTASVILYAPSR